MNGCVGVCWGREKNAYVMHGRKEEAVWHILWVAYRKAQDGRGDDGSYFVEDLVQGTEGDLKEGKRVARLKSEQ